jgi:hypothetical protein
MGVQYMVSDSTKLATFPSSSMPRLLNRVPALKHESRDIKVKDDGRPVFDVLAGAEEGGIVIVRTNPRIADVRIPDLSRDFLS